MKIGIIGAMASEIKLLLEHMQNKKENSVGKNTFYEGEIYGTDVVVVKSGIGKVAAALCVQILHDIYSCNRIINTGVAGGVGSGLKIGDFVIGTKLVQHDFDLLALGYAKGNLNDDDNKNSPTFFNSDEQLVSLFKKSAGDILKPEQIHEGTIASGDIFVSSSELKHSLVEQFNAAAAEMEGAAIAQACNANNLKFIVVRAISDLADEQADISFATFEKQTADLSAKILIEMLKNLA